ncbi:DNA-directed RNA polymerase subunit beta [Nocardia asteroides]|uniref:DNA-directed RNA polymerase subunit beta n=1 Tax=Nocardia asteroides TaxID=1824 RepID=UPI00342A491A
MAYGIQQTPGRETHFSATRSAASTRYVGEYRSAHGLPAEIDPATGRVAIRAGAIVGFMVPAALGARLRAALERAGEGGGPILAHTRSQTWTFLAQRDSSTDDITARTRRWWRARVSVLTANALIGLPCAGTIDAGRRVWIVAPHSCLRPATSTVIAALDEILSEGMAQ